MLVTIFSAFIYQLFFPIFSANYILKNGSFNPVMVGMLALPTLVLVTTPSVTQTGNKLAIELDQQIRSLLTAVKEVIQMPQMKKVIIK